MNDLLIIFILISIVLFLVLLYDRYYISQKIRKYEEQLTILRNSFNALHPTLRKFYDWKMLISNTIEIKLPNRKVLLSNNEKKLLLQIYDELLKYTDPEQFLKLANERLNNLPNIIQQNYTGINARELYFIVYFLLEIPEEDILLLTGYSSNSIPTIKNRICKKLEINKSNELYSSLINLMSKT